MKRKKKVPAPLPRFTIWSCCYNSNFIHLKKMAMMTTSLYNVWKLTVSKFIVLSSLKFCIPFHDWLFFVDNSSLESSLLLFFSLVFYFFFMYINDHKYLDYCHLVRWCIPCIWVPSFPNFNIDKYFSSFYIIYIELKIGNVPQSRNTLDR